MKIYVKHKNLIFCIGIFCGFLGIFEFIYKQYVNKTNLMLQKLKINLSTFDYRLLRYQQYESLEMNRRGAGENGQAVNLTYKEKINMKIEILKIGYHNSVSKRISLHRSLPDFRSDECKSKNYPQNLPTASVIITFYNELWPTLLRTIHSVVNRSPPQHLREIILVDDFSLQEVMQVNITNYIQNEWPDGIVKVFRSEKRNGALKSKLTGAKLAIGNVIIFLDSHVEVTKGWLEPILDRLSHNYQSFVIPVVMEIDVETFAFKNRHKLDRFGSFWWNMDFGWDEMPKHFQKERRTSSDPIKTGTLPIGIFAANRINFFNMGSFDTELIWYGSENLELSFRVWMCGGMLEILPCSCIGHIAHYRSSIVRKNIKYFHGINSKRVAEIWLDDYKRLFYLQKPHLKNKFITNMESRMVLRNYLLCNSFEWYLENVVPNKFIPDKDHIAYGYVKNTFSNLCLDILDQDETERGDLYISVFTCHHGFSHAQFFSLTLANVNLSDRFIGKTASLIRREWGCLTVDLVNETVKFRDCNSHLVDYQLWIYEKDMSLLSVGLTKCLDATDLHPRDSVAINVCDSNNMQQKWKFEHNET